MSSVVVARHRTTGRASRGLVRTVGSALALAALVLTQVAVAPAHAAAPTSGPVLTSPAMDAQVSENPVLSWTGVPGAAKYRVQVSTSATFSVGVTTTDTVNTHLTPVAELPSQSLYWRVAASDSGSGLGPWSPVGAFVKVAGGAPDGLQPDDGATFTYPAQSPVLQWSPLPGIKSYKIEIDDDTSFINPPVSATTVSTAYAVTYALTFDKPYYWRVSGTTVANAQTATSDPRTFTVSWPAGVGQPVLTSPPNTTLTPVGDVVLTWAPVDGAKSYLLDVSPNPDFTNNLTETNKVVFGTQYSPARTYLNGSYYWRVRAVDTLLRQGPWSEVRTFRRASNLPDAPTLLTPANGASVTAASFTWSAVPNGGVYEIQFDADGNFGIAAIGCTTYHAAFTGYVRPSGQPRPTPVYPAAPASPTAPNCAPTAGTWQWRVRAIDTPPGAPGVSGGQPGPFSAPRTVTLGAAPTIAGPLAALAPSDYLSPADCEAPACTDVLPDTPTLTWNAVPGATWYQVRIALDRQFTNEVQRYDVTGTQLRPRESLPDNATGSSYFWWVQPCSSPVDCVEDSQASIEAGAHAFRKLADPVELLSPANVATVTDVVPFTWADLYATQPAATGAGAYRIQIANDASFTSIVDTATVDQTTYEADSKHYADGTYYWRVQAIDSSGLGLSWSVARSFTKLSGTPSVLTATRLDASSALPVLGWDATPFVSGYRVQIYSGTDPLFPAVNLKKEVTVALPTYTPDVALPQGTYSWRVRRLDASGNPGPWQVLDAGGSLPTFDVSAPVPLLLSPSDGLSFGGHTVLLSWTPVKGAATYRLESSASPGFTPALDSLVTVMTAWAPVSATVYPDSVPIYWRVRALDSANQIVATSAVRTFLKDSKAPTAVFTTTGATTTLRPSVTVTFSENVTGVGPASVVLRRAGTTIVPSVLVCADSLAAVVDCSGSNIRKVAVTAASNVVPGETYTVSTTSDIADPLANALIAGSVSFRAVLAVQQNSGSPVLTAGWTTVAAPAASAGSFARTVTKGASVSWTFKGNGVRVLWMAYKNYGKVGIYVDGVLKATVDQYAAGLAARYTYIPSLTNAVHTVKVVALGTRTIKSTGTFVTVDGFSTT